MMTSMATKVEIGVLLTKCYKVEYFFKSIFLTLITLNLKKVANSTCWLPKFFLCDVGQGS